ncbi:MAG: dTDP-glucose 4,6-dehydratase [Desulfobacterales bacterium]|nr:MAG: dTDP-glucose 4,6-dehydratase [Desulfobacterales bacterium]
MIREGFVQKKTVLITGANGFIGFHITKYLLKKGYGIIAIGNPQTLKPLSYYSNLLSIEHFYLPSQSFINIVNIFRPECVVHCAGSASVPISLVEPYEDFQNNTIATAFVLETIRKHCPDCYFLYFSSAAVYGNPSRLPVREIDPPNPISPYGYHKFLAEIAIEEYAAIYDIKSTIFRVFSAYGEYLQKQVVYDLLKKFSAPSNLPVILHGKGNETRDFIYIDDLLMVVDKFLHQPQYGIFNLASGIQTKISSLAELIKFEIGSDRNFEFNGVVQKGTPDQWEADISKLELIGSEPRVSLEEGIRNTCGWFLKTLKKELRS